MRRTILATCAVLGALLAVPAAASAADAMLAVTDQNRLLRFNSDAPGAILSDVPLRGLAANEQAVGLDTRPANDHVYVITNQSRALQLDVITGEVRPAYGPFSPALAGSLFGSDFDPVNDALRIVSDADQNLRITAPATTTADTNLAYAAGDPGAGTNPVVNAIAYTNSTPGATSTGLYGIDTARDALVTLANPANGQLTTVGALGEDFDGPAGFDISPAGNVAYAALRQAGQQTHSLWRINLANGAASPHTRQPAIGVPANAGELRGIAVVGTVSDDETPPVLSVAFSSTILEENTAVLKPSVSCNEMCTVTVEAEVEGRAAGTGTATITGPGRATVDVRLNQAARNRIARPGTELISLDIEAVDAAGNRRTQNNRISRTQTLAVRRGGG